MKTKLLLKQLGEIKNDDELEYEVIETSNAQWACGEILCRDDVIDMARNDEYDIKIYK